MATGFRCMLKHLSSTCDWHHSYFFCYLPSMKKSSSALGSLHFKLSTLLVFMVFLGIMGDIKYSLGEFSNMKVDISNLKLWKGNRQTEGSNTVPERSMEKKKQNMLQPVSTCGKRTWGSTPLVHLTGELSRSYNTEGSQYNLAEMSLSLLSKSAISGFYASAILQNETLSFFFFLCLIRKLIFLIMFWTAKMPDVRLNEFLLSEYKRESTNFPNIRKHTI